MSVLGARAMAGGGVPVGSRALRRGGSSAFSLVSLSSAGSLGPPGSRPRPWGPSVPSGRSLCWVALSQVLGRPSLRAVAYLPNSEPPCPLRGASPPPMLVPDAAEPTTQLCWRTAFAPIPRPSALRHGPGSGWARNAGSEGGGGALRFINSTFPRARSMQAQPPPVRLSQRDHNPSPRKVLEGSGPSGFLSHLRQDNRALCLSTVLFFIFF